MSAEPLKPCPFCGERPRLTLRPDDAEASTYFAAVACYCGGYSACAHKMATATTADEAEAKARALWDDRATLDAAVAAAREDFERECSDTDKILRALGLEPANCRTDGGSLALRELLGAIEHRDVMTRRAARQAERERCAKIAETVHPHWTHIARAIREDQP